MVRPAAIIGFALCLAVTTLATGRSSADGPATEPAAEQKRDFLIVLEAAPDQISSSIEIVRNRLELRRVEHFSLDKAGPSRIELRLTEIENLDEVILLVGTRGLLAWCLVEEEVLARPAYSAEKLLDLYDATVEAMADKGPPADGPEDAVIPYKDGEGRLLAFAVFDKLVVEEGLVPRDMILRVYEHTGRDGQPMREPLLLRAVPVLRGSDLAVDKWRVERVHLHPPVVAFKIGDRDAVARFREVTGRYSAKSENKIDTDGWPRGWRLAILRDDRVLSAPSIMQQLSDTGVITGFDDADEAADFVVQLRSGALDPSVRVVDVQELPPDGDDS